MLLLSMPYIFLETTANIYTRYYLGSVHLINLYLKMSLLPFDGQIQKEQDTFEYVYFYLYSTWYYRLERHQKVSTTFIRRNHVSIWNWTHEINQEDILKKSEASEFIIDETLIKAGNEYVWLWIAEESCGIRLRTNH